MDETRHKRRAIFTSLLKRELFLLSVNPALYVSGLFFVLCVYYGFFFIHRFFIPGEGSSDLRNFFSSMPAASVLCIPALTMHMHEKDGDFILSAPLEPIFIRLAKWLAVFIFFSFFVLVSVFVPLGASFFAPIDISVLCTGILGILASSAALIAFAQWITLVCRSNSLSFFISSLVFALSAFIHRGIQRFNVNGALGALCRFVSFSWHFESAVKGIIDSRDIVFYLCIAVLCLSLSAFHTEKIKYARFSKTPSRQKKELYTSCRGVFLLCCMILWNGGIFYARLDLTKNRMYSLSDTTKAVLARLQNRLTVSYYVSAELERALPHVRRIRDLLYDYADARNVGVRVITVSKDSHRQAAENAGVGGQYLPLGGADENVPLYSGIVLEYEEKIARIPFLLTGDDLEFGMADKIAFLTGRGRRNVFLVNASESDIDDEYPYVIPWLESAGFSVEVLSTGALTRLQPSFTPVLLIGSSALTAEQSEALSSLLQSGGRIFAALSANTVNTQSDWKAYPVPGNPFLKLLEKRGIFIDTALLEDETCARIAAAEQSTAGKDGSAQNINYIAYPFFVRVEKQTANKAHPVSKAFAGLDLFWPSPMELSRSAEYPDDKLDALAFTSPSAWVQYPLQEGESPYRTDPFSAEKPVKTAEGQYPAAAALQTAQGGKMIVVPDRYFISRMSAFTANSSNYDFLVNGLLWLSGEDGLLSIKNRSFTDYSLAVDASNPAFIDKKNAVLAAVPLCFISCFVLLLLGVHRYRKKLKKESIGERR